MSDTETPVTDDLSFTGLHSSLAMSIQSQLLIHDEEHQVLMLLEPGVSIENVRHFLETTLSVIPGLVDLLPDSLPVDGVTLSSLIFTPGSNGSPYHLEFVVGWGTAHWEIIPNLLALAAPSITVYVTGKADADDRTQVSATVAGTVEIKDIPIFIEVELPDGTFEARLLQEDAVGDASMGGLSADSPQPEDAGNDTRTAGHPAGALLQHFQVGGTSQSGNTQGFDLGLVRLNDLTIRGHIPTRRLLLHLALDSIRLGPGDLAAQLTIDYIGGANSQLSGMVWGQYDILAKDSTTTLFSLMLAASYDGPGQNWRFEGGATSGEDVTIKQVVEAFTDSDNIPGVLDRLELRYLHLAYETGSGNFEFECDVEVGALFGEHSSVEMIVDVHLHKADGASGTPTTYTKTFGGRLLFKLQTGMVLEFDLIFDQSPHGNASDTTFIAVYKNASGSQLNIGDLISLIDANVSLPLSITLQDAFFMYNKRAAPDGASVSSRSLFGLDIGSGIDLSALPLVGKMLPKDASLTLGIQPLIAIGTPDPATAAYFTASDLASMSTLIPDGGITLPSKDISDQVMLGVTIAIGKDQRFHFDLPIDLNSKSEVKPGPRPTAREGAAATPTLPTQSAPAPSVEQSIQPTHEPTPTSPAAAGVTPAPAGSSASGIQWIDVGKAYGPAHFNRIGLQFEADQKMVWAYLDASLQLSALTFTLNGLGVGTPITTLEPHFRLLGIGIDYASGPVEIGASFLHTHVEAVGDTPAHDEYSGLATIKTPTLALMAVGSYADLPDYKSLFLYAVLNSPLGGPAFFFVTGLAVGFGFNREIKIPDVSDVGRFPLVNLAVGGAGSPVPTDPAARTDYIHEIMDTLRDSIYPMSGQYFLAAGIHFTSFQLIDSFALLIVRFGSTFEVDVLGLSTVVIPAPVPGGPKVAPIAEIQLALKAVFNPGEGILSLEAQLTNNSYLLDRNCHLTGGFAFYTWFAGSHSGDFVLTLGGYHPLFQKPEHYPTVPRLGLNWQVTPDLSLKGGIYFALCPHLLMVGGKLEALYTSGAKKAWFTLEIDFLISWKPTHYDAHAYLEIGVEYTYTCFGSHHISVSVGADIHVWGPDFAGHANIHLWVVTFDIDFGAATTPKLEPLGWTDFQKSFLPPQPEKMVDVAVVAGLISTAKVAGTEQYVINPRDFRLNVDLVMPYNALSIGDVDVQIHQLRQVPVDGVLLPSPFQKHDNDYQQQSIGSTFTVGVFGIAPMARSAGQIRSILQLTVEKEAVDGAWIPADEQFGFQPVLKRVARALWGEKLQPDLNDDRSIDNVPSGMELIPAMPPTPGETQWIAKQCLQYTTSHVEPGIGFEPMTAFNPTEFDATDAAFTALKAHLTDEATMHNRRSILDALGFDYDRLDIALTSSIVDALVVAPQTGTLV